MRKISVLVLSLLLVLTLAGCDESGELDLEALEDQVNEAIIEEDTVLDEVIETDELDIEEELILLADLTWGASAALSSETLTIEDMLLYAIQDEYTAQAEYDYIIANFEVTKPFTNIVVAEGSHIDMLLPLFASYEFDIPENIATEHLIPVEGVYQAFETGVYAEIINIAMYNAFLEYDLPEDIEAVFIALRDASINHLNAFEKNLAKLE